MTMEVQTNPLSSLDPTNYIGLKSLCNLVRNCCQYQDQLPCALMCADRCSRSEVRTSIDIPKGLMIEPDRQRFLAVLRLPLHIRILTSLYTDIVSRHETAEEPCGVYLTCRLSGLGTL
jgi:hypothetical protein